MEEEEEEEVIEEEVEVEEEKEKEEEEGILIQSPSLPSFISPHAVESKYLSIQI